ncbi:endoglucanase 5-like [Salvia miltiorrhiza]|uniref:endoglucanase 5-like n=1 Tax=Salvia miltiorrhiza TaxID=226208 RepID=UPI0025ACF9A3|nr:endoglucanase 5-like [Salvia miltiorrhiza]
MHGGGGAYTSTLQQYQAKADYFTCACMQKNDSYNVPMTPGGLLYLWEWNNLQYSASAAFVIRNILQRQKAFSSLQNHKYIYISIIFFLLVCAEFATEKSNLWKADYILGKNPKNLSYVVGCGDNYPVHVHLPPRFRSGVYSRI